MNGNDTVSPIIKTVEKAFIADESQLAGDGKKLALPKNPFIRRINEPKQSQSLQEARDVLKNKKKDSDGNGKQTFE